MSGLESLKWKGASAELDGQWVGEGRLVFSVVVRAGFESVEL